MSQEITSARGRITLPDSFVMPPLLGGPSGLLAAAVRDILYPHPDVQPARYSLGLQEQACEALAALERLMDPASAETIAAFMWPLADAVEFTPEEDIFWRRVHVLGIASRDIPHVAWTQKACLALVRSAGRNLPSAWTIFEAIQPAVQPLLDRHRALRRIVQ